MKKQPTAEAERFYAGLAQLGLIEDTGRMSPWRIRAGVKYDVLVRLGVPMAAVSRTAGSVHGVDARGRVTLATPKEEAHLPYGERTKRTVAGYPDVETALRFADTNFGFLHGNRVRANCAKVGVAPTQL